ncbi:Zinc/iron permease [Rhodocollybia butyracea]|uniref:Zinc/iron permease n=1 Tax=Rhodocollybia butyracea TaxID=206335 RepID=A0A9P5Q329_9AGAR|nr:Zinc/iron permease [Rhodocollybia butyracea]
MTVLLGASSFGCGMLPLSFVFSKSHLVRLTTLGSGLLLGTALGVIIPEGIEALADAHPTSEISPSRVALALLCGFIIMLVIEQVFAPHSHSSTPSSIALSNAKPSPSSELEFDAELGELEGEHGMPRAGPVGAPMDSTHAEPSAEMQAMPLTLGLVIHSLADGFALGVSSFPTSNEYKDSSGLSVIVFFAVVIHKCDTYISSFYFLVTGYGSLSPQCRKHLIVFSLATPTAAILTYLALNFFGGSQHPDWPGMALLLSGGTFLNVAALVSHRSDANSSGEISDKARLLLTILGIIAPFTLSSLFGHGH